MIEWLPTAREEVESFALPELRVTLPSRVVPSLKVTVPVAVDGVTVAVKVTDWPNVEGLTPEVRLVVEVAWPTVYESTIEVLLPKVESPP